MNLPTKHPLFSGISEADLEELLRHLEAKTKSFEKNSFIFEEGSPVRHIHILLSGAALIFQEDVWGNRAILSELLPGDLFGEAFCFAPDSVASVSVATVEPCKVLLLDARNIMAPGASPYPGHGKIVQNILRILAEKNILLTQKMSHVTQRTTREKLLSYLSSQAKAVGQSDFSIPFSRQELADYLAVERSAMSAVLAQMKAEGLLDYHKNNFRLKL